MSRSVVGCCSEPSQRDQLALRRYRLNLVCKSWRAALFRAPTLWEAISIDPRHRSSSRRDTRLKEHLPTAAALKAWARAYGSCIRHLNVAHMHDGSRKAGCASPSSLQKVMKQVHCLPVGRLRQPAAPGHGSSNLPHVCPLASACSSPLIWRNSSWTFAMMTIQPPCCVCFPVPH